MAWLFLVVTAVVVVCIALVAVGSVTFTLAEQPRQSFYDVDEAVELVADALPDHVTADVSYDDVRTILMWHLDYLEAKGVAYEPGDDPEDGPGREPQPAGVDVEPVDPARGPLVADDDEALAYVLGKLAESDLVVDDVSVVEVLACDRRYLEAIGAIGREVPPPGAEPAVGGSGAGAGGSGDGGGTGDL